MKTAYRIITAFMIVLILSCGGNDDDNSTAPIIETASVIGEWQRSTGTFLGGQWEYFIIKSDNTLQLLGEDERGFKDEFIGNYNATDTQITAQIGFFGNSLVNYTVTATTLELQESNGNLSTYTRITNAPTSDQWIRKLSILSQGDAPWNETADIAYNGSQILLGNGYEAEDIGLINPETFALDGVILTTQSAFAVEVEKFDVPDKYIFQSNNGFSYFRAYFENSNMEDFQSIELGSWIYGLASVDRYNVWASSGSEQTLYLLNYEDLASQTIVNTIALNRRIEGMDYQDGFLFICSGGNIYKCDVSSGFEVIETITLEGYEAYGIAFDGTNFWINARPSSSEGPYQIIQTSLTL